MQSPRTYYGMEIGEFINDSWILSQPLIPANQSMILESCASCLYACLVLLCVVCTVSLKRISNEWNINIDW